MKNRPLYSLFLFSLVAWVTAAGCSDSEEPDGLVVEPPKSPYQGLVVVSSDYKSASVSLLDAATFTVTRDDCINSGTTAPALSLSLSGDVVLPSGTHPDHEVLLIDRTNSALTWLNPQTCEVKRQLAVGTGFFSNPQDAVTLSANKVYVTRYNRNEQPTADPADLDEGDDVLIIDPNGNRPLGRIPLSSYATEVNSQKMQARPGPAVRANDKVYIALANQSGDFLSAGDGRVVVIDPASDSVAGTIDLPGLKACTGLEYESASKTLLVTCGGSFSDGPAQADHSAIVAIDVGANPPAVKSTVTAAALQNRPLSTVAPMGGQGGAALAVTYGELAGPPSDQLWSCDLNGKTCAALASANSSFSYGSLLSDPERSQVFLLDGSMDAPRVHRYDVTGAPALKGSLDANPSRGLPPRGIGWY